MKVSDLRVGVRVHTAEALGPIMLGTVVDRTPKRFSVEWDDIRGHPLTFSYLIPEDLEYSTLEPVDPNPYDLEPLS